MKSILSGKYYIIHNTYGRSVKHIVSFYDADKFDVCFLWYKTGKKVVNRFRKRSIKRYKTFSIEHAREIKSSDIDIMNLTSDNDIYHHMNKTKCDAYRRDVVTVKQFPTYVKLCYSMTVRKKGYVDKDDKLFERGERYKGKDDASISRTKSKIFEYAFCNPWNYFITLTIDKEKFDRYNLKEYKKSLAKFLDNKKQRDKRYHDVKYLLIPEFHKDGAVHMHGLIMGVDKSVFQTNEHGYLDWNDYSEKFGFCSLSPIENHEATARYITKYISKDVATTVTECNARMYYCSQGLKVADKIVSFDNATLTDYDYKADFWGVKTIENEDYLAYIDQIV